MKIFKVLGYYGLGLVILFSCQKPTIIESVISPSFSSAVFIYMIADNNLSFYATRDINEMEAGLKPEDSGKVFVFVDKGLYSKPSHPYILSIVPDTTDKIVSPILFSYPERNSADIFFLDQVLLNVESVALEKYLTIDHIIFWSHGNGWLPKGYSMYSDSFVKGSIISPIIPTKSFGLDEYDSPNSQTINNNEMDIVDLASILKGRHYKTLSFDACFMGSIEVIYNFKDIADRIIASPAEIPSLGFPYDKVIADLLHSSDMSKEMSKSIVNFYSHQNGFLNSYTITVVNSSYLDSLARFVHHLYTEKTNNIDTATLRHFQQYDRLQVGFFYDFKEVFSSIIGDDVSLQHQLDAVLKNLIYYEKHSNKMMEILELNNVSGLSVYVPQKEKNRVDIDPFYQTLPWHEKTHTNNFWSFSF